MRSYGESPRRQPLGGSLLACLAESSQLDDQSHGHYQRTQGRWLSKAQFPKAPMFSGAHAWRCLCQASEVSWARAKHGKTWHIQKFLWRKCLKARLGTTVHDSAQAAHYVTPVYLCDLMHVYYLFYMSSWGATWKKYNRHDYWSCWFWRHDAVGTMCPESKKSSWTLSSYTNSLKSSELESLLKGCHKRSNLARKPMRSNMWIREHELSLQTFPGKIHSSLGSRVQDLRIPGRLNNQ